MMIEFQETMLKGVYLIHSNVIRDERGSFVKVLRDDTFRAKGLEANFRESFYSISHRNVIRGMHFHMPPQDHVKLVYVPAGKITDVILDLRKNSSTYGTYIAVTLMDEDASAVYIPKGCAHGFLSLTDSSIVVYLQSTIYSADCDAGIRWDSFGMNWQAENPVLSERDRQFMTLSEFRSPF